MIAKKETEENELPEMRRSSGLRKRWWIAAVAPVGRWDSAPRDLVRRGLEAGADRTSGGSL